MSRGYPCLPPWFPKVIQKMEKKNPNPVSQTSLDPPKTIKMASKNDWSSERDLEVWGRSVCAFCFFISQNTQSGFMELMSWSLHNNSHKRPVQWSYLSRLGWREDTQPWWGMSTALTSEALSDPQATELIPKSISNVQQNSSLVQTPCRTFWNWHHPKLWLFLSSFIVGASSEAGEGCWKRQHSSFLGWHLFKHKPLAWLFPVSCH